MNITSSGILVTGGNGFMGSHLVDRLMMDGFKVMVLDNLSNGSLLNLQSWLEHERFSFLKGDWKRSNTVEKAVKNVGIIFHLAANPEVRIGETDPSVHIQENLIATYNLLEAIRNNALGKHLVFFSTSTVYGETTLFPTPEDYDSLIPISTYGASKLGCEALISSYAYTF